MDSQSVALLWERLRQRDWRALSRAVSLVENETAEGDWLLERAFWSPAGETLVLGVTGAGGAGKSTLVSRLIQAYRAQGQTVGVLAVDPSSPCTGGALLGDRVRMGTHSLDDGVFIRSLASRGSMGGLSQSAHKALYLYRAYGFDIILLETLGVGQEETDVSCFADVTVVVLAPGNGDDIQLSKAGTQEIADIFVINKGDKPEAEVLYQQMKAMFGETPGRRPVILKTTASENKGISRLLHAVEGCREMAMKASAARRQRRMEYEVLSELLTCLRIQLHRKAEPWVARVLRGECTPWQAGQALAAQVKFVSYEDRAEPGEAVSMVPHTGERV